ncbi:MAG: DUF1294 domain-containing protein [Methanomassiliicoccus sp.]|nr:DUF1294 domain-containing protein [Methanomassiliicoccus sp.]
MVSTTAVLLGIYLMMNLASFVVYYLDKRAAIRRLRRIPESTLLLIALIAPFGAVGAMKLFHHKTRKLKFYLVYAFAVLHIAIIAYLLLRL